MREIDTLDVLGAVVVLDLSAGPIDCFNSEELVLLDRRHVRDVCSAISMCAL